MLSLIILVVAGIYVGLWYLLIRALPSRWAKAAVALVAIYLPFWDVPYGYYNFRTLCAEEGGLRVMGKVAPQPSVLLDSSSLRTEQEREKMLGRGFRFVEMQFHDGSSISYSKSSAGPNQSVRVSSPVSVYGIRTEMNRRMPWGIVRHDQVLYVRATNQIVARNAQVAWRIWLRDKVLGLPGGQIHCQDQFRTDRLEQLVLAGSSVGNEEERSQ
jgi:hypothetical protein